MNLLEVRNVAKSFGGVRALDGISLAVSPGEVVALIGPNGAGKSTLFNVIDGRLRADAGAIAFDGQVVAAGHPGRWFARRVGRTFQVAAVFASMTVRQNVQTALASKTGDRGFFRDATARHADAAQALLDRIGLGARAGAPVATLAYPELKRLDFALALANSPRLLLMDEPTAGMAADERTALMNLVRYEAAQRGAAVLFTEHSMDVVFGYAQRIDVLVRGRLVASGDPRQIADDATVREAYLGSVDLSEHVQ